MADGVARTTAATGDFGLRSISAAVLLVAALAAIWLGGIVFTGVVLVIAALAWLEWSTITAVDLPAWLRLAVGVPVLLGLALFSMEMWSLALPLIAGPVALAMLAALFYPSFGWLGAGLVYIAVPSAGLLSLRGIPDTGAVAVLVVFAIVWATDTFAYAVGRTVGGIKLWPRISPKKTWSGAFGGLVAAMAIGAVVSLFGYFGPGHALLLAAILSLAAQAGDLAESAVKRQFAVKDSGRIIPGHGGVLDRIDGLAGAATAAWLVAGTGIGGALFSYSEAVP